jgi:hypothetical protein
MDRERLPPNFLLTCVVGWALFCLVMDDERVIAVDLSFRTRVILRSLKEGQELRQMGRCRSVGTTGDRHF